MNQIELVFTESRELLHESVGYFQYIRASSEGSGRRVSQSQNDRGRRWADAAPSATLTNEFAEIFLQLTQIGGNTALPLVAVCRIRTYQHQMPWLCRDVLCRAQPRQAERGKQLG